MSVPDLDALAADYRRDGYVACEGLLSPDEVEALRAESGGLRIGTIVSLQPARPSSGSDLDRDATVRFDAMWNGACLDPLRNGAYPVAVAADFAPLIADGDLAAIHQPLDFLGGEISQAEGQVDSGGEKRQADRPKLLFNARGDAGEAGAVRHVAGEAVDAPLRGRQGGEFGEVGLRSGGGGDGPSVLHQAQRYGVPQAGAGARDPRDFAYHANQSND